MASAETSSAQHDARLNQQPADRVVFARLRRVVKRHSLRLGLNIDFFNAIMKGCALFESQEPTMVHACGELIHDRGVGLKAEGLGTN